MDMQLSFYLLFSLAIFSIFPSFVLAADWEWPYCSNFASEKGFPAGCATTVDDLCVYQDDACAALFCDFTNLQLGSKFIPCNEECKKSETPIVTIDNYQCHCMQGAAQMCPQSAAIPSSSQRYIAQSGNSTVSKLSRISPLWGAKIIMTTLSVIPVYCSDKFKCNLGISLCEQEQCLPGQCHFEEHCYFVKSVTGLSPPMLTNICNPGKLLAVEVNPEKMFLFDLLSQSYEGSQQLTYILTSGKVQSESTDGVWNGWSSSIGADVVSLMAELTPEIGDRYLYLEIGSNLEVNWRLMLESNYPDKVMCEMFVADATTLEEENCETTTEEPTTVTEEEYCETTTEQTTTETDEEDCDTTTEQTTTEEEEDYDTTTPEETTSTEETTDSSTTIPIEQCKLTCIQEDQYGEKWECCNNTACSRSCPIEASGEAYWVCGNFTGSYNFTTSCPDYSDCHNTWLQNLTEQIEENSIKSWDVIQNLEYYVSDSALFGHEMPDVLQFINTSMNLLKEEQSTESAVTQLNQRKFMAESSMRTMDGLFALEKQWEQLKEFEQTKVGMKMQKVTEWIGFSVTEAAKVVNRPFNMWTEWTTTLMEAQYVQHYPDNSSGPVLKFPLSKHRSRIELQEVPFIVFEGQSILIEAVGTILPIAPAEMLFPARLNCLGDLRKQLNSEIVTLSLVGPDTRALTHFSSPDAIIVTLMHEYDAKGPDDSEVHRALHPGEKPTAIQGSEQCVFWNSSLGNNGQWDTRGCYIVSHTRSETVCACNHLSSFALIMDMHNYMDKDPVMEVLGVVCSSASIVCLLLTLIVLHFLRGIQGERNSIGKHVCLCLMLGHFLSLILLDQSFLHLPHEVCIAVGVVLHYVFLSAFMWMAVEGHHLYRLVVRVFDSGRDLSRIYLLVAYGTPAIIVGITGIIALVTQDAVYGNDDLCWLSSPNYIWAFLGPAAVITTLNFLVLIQALRVAVTAGGSQKKSFIERVRIWIRGWFALSALLGVTWLFGFIYMEIYYNLAYVFIILTGLQGVFIFMSRVAFNEQVKSAFKRSIKQRAMLSRFYSLAWKGRSSDSSMQQSSWFLAGSSSSQLDLASSSSSSYWAHTPSRRRSSTTNQPDAFTDPDGYTTLPANFLHQTTLTGIQSDKVSNTWQFIKRKHSKEEEAPELPPYSVSQSSEIQQAWSSCREQDVLSEIAEEDEDQGPDKWNKF